MLDWKQQSVELDSMAPPLLRVAEGKVRSYAEAHCLGDFDGPSALDLARRAEVIAGCGPTAANLHDVVHAGDVQPLRFLTAALTGSAFKRAPRTR